MLGLLAVLAGCSMLRPEPPPAVPPASLPDITGWRSPPPTRTYSVAPEFDESTPAPAASLWDRIREDLVIGGMEYAEVRRELEYLAAKPRFLYNSSRRAAPYLHFIVESIEQRDVPMEIALLPIIESGYQPRVGSPHGAVGIWQFMPATGRRFGLKQTRWYDGRRDIVAATHAALDYLMLLKERYDGDWLLALAAYNVGTGNLERAMESNREAGKPDDFWSLSLPPETRRFVPRLLALAEIVKDPDRYGVRLEPVPNARYFAEIDLGGPLDLRKVPGWAGISADEFKALNPGFAGWHTDPGGPYTVLVPRAARATVARAVAELVPEERIAASEYTVRSGDTLSGIAERFRSTVAEIRVANGLRGQLIHPGQTLMIPGAEAVVEAPLTRKSHAVHVVRRGDTLWDIARLYDRRVAEIANHNGMLVKTTLRPGQQLAIPGQAPLDTAATGEDRHYRVREGDSLWTISRQFGVSVKELMKWNGLSRGQYLQPGQRLVVGRAAGSRSAT